jgi:hypothetical protein
VLFQRLSRPLQKSVSLLANEGHNDQKTGSLMIIVIISRGEENPESHINVAQTGDCWMLSAQMNRLRTNQQPEIAYEELCFASRRFSVSLGGEEYYAIGIVDCQGVSTLFLENYKNSFLEFSNPQNCVILAA